jgi:TolB-like protein/DNA-binding winged helix-turn-helix (wHTH) protein/Flp pilus assembly protein TadD
VPDHAVRPPTAPALSIGDWELVPDANELVREGGAIRVEPKVMQVLLRLAERPGAVVTREELLDDVWPGVVVGDEALTQTIIKLRRAVGDDPRRPAFVETIAKRGYRLIAPVQRAPVSDAAVAMPSVAIPAGPAATAAPSAPPPVATAPAARAKGPASPTRRRAWLATLGALVVALLVVAGAQWPALSPSGEKALPAANDEPTVTVVPFESLGERPDQAYLARGFSNDLMTDLSRLGGLRVVRSDSTATSATNARFVVTGSVQRDADTLRVNVRLTDSQTGQQLWSERFERPFGDLFAMQNAITRGVVELLPGKLDEVARQNAARRYTKNLAAYDQFLRAQALFLVRNPADNEAARAAYRKAIELDPTFARAYAGLAMTYALEPRLRPSSDAAPALARALELAETARGMDPEIPEVHWAIGLVHVQQRRHDAAMAALNRAIALNRSYADAYALMAGIHTYVGEPARSIPLVRTALRLDPGGGYLYFMVLGRAYLFQGDTEQALINQREAATRNPVDLETRIFLAAALAANNELAGAEWELQEIRALAPAFALDAWLQTYPLAHRPQEQRLRELLARVQR